MSDEKPPNHACFEAAMADILDQLYRNFPAPTKFDHRKAFEGAQMRCLMPDHCKAEFNIYETLYGNTLAFLEREGIVHIKRFEDHGSSGVVLTSKGFLILSKPLDGIDAKEPLGQRFGKIAKQTGTEFLASFISNATGALIAHLAKSA